jgi:hypothetical protein
MGMWNFMRLIKKTSIHIGINDYKGPNLSGCVNDAQGMAFMFRTLGYTGPDPILDQEATRANVWEALDEAVANLKWGHRLVVTYSGHGTQLPDQDSDEFDHLDEAFVLADYLSGGFLVDDDMHRIFSYRPAGSRVTVISDSCFSGGQQRVISLDSPSTFDPSRKAKFLAPFEIFEGSVAKKIERIQQRELKEAKPRTDAFVITGCKETEVSYDAYVGGKFQGAMTWALLKSYENGMSMRALEKVMSNFLPTPTYNQTPQFLGTAWQRTWGF